MENKTITMSGQFSEQGLAIFCQYHGWNGTDDMVTFAQDALKKVVTEAVTVPILAMQAKQAETEIATAVNAINATKDATANGTIEAVESGLTVSIA
jgi:hypothetical protein